MYDLRGETEKVLLKNREIKDGFQYTVPSSSSYPHQWLWDSCFHAIVLSHINIEDAKKEIRSLVYGQFKNGMIPHIIFRVKGEISNTIKWVTDNTSSITHPPLIAYSVWQIFKKDGDRLFLDELYPKLDAYYRYLLSRDLHGHHLVGIVNPDESGEDNSPRFDVALGLKPEHSFEENNRKRFDMLEKNLDWSSDENHYSKDFFWIKDVPYTVYLIENMELMSKIAHELGNNEGEIFFSQQSVLMKNAMREYMYEDGIYWSISGHDHVKIKVKTWAIFAPLVVSMYTKEEAERVVNEYLLNKNEFWSAYAVPTTSMSEESYNPGELSDGPAWLRPNWRGPVWMATNWFIFRGLKRYGYDSIAEEIMEQSLSLLKNSGFREYYNPETGRGMGALDFTWGGLVLDMKEGVFPVETRTWSTQG